MLILKDDLDTWLSLPRSAQPKKVPLKASTQPSLCKNLEQTDSFAISVNELNFERKYFEALKRSSQEDLLFVSQSLQEDPKRMSFDDKHPCRRSNLVNFDGEFPLYLATKYNNLEMLKILFKGEQIFEVNS